MSAAEAVGGAPPADHAAARAARRDPRRHRASRSSRSSSSASGTCRCCPATSTCAEALDNRVRKVAIPAPRGAILDRDGRRDRRQPRRDRRPARSAAAAAAERDAAREWGQQMTRAQAPPKGHRGEPRRSPPAPPELEARCSGLGARARDVAAHDQRAHRPAARRAPYANIRVRSTCRRRCATTCSSTSAQFPGVAVQQVYLRRYPQGTTGRPAARHDRRDRARRSSSTTRYRGVAPGTSSARTGIECAYDRYLRGAPGVAEHHGRRARPARRASASRATRGPGRSCARRSTCRSSSTGQRALAARIQGGPGTAGRVRRAGPAQRPDPRDGLLPDASTRASSPSRSRSSATTRSSASRPARRCSTARSRPAIPTGSTFKPITALAALDAG